MAYLQRWEVRSVGVQPGVAGDVIRLDEILQELWEPFGVTWGDGRFVYHLRRITEHKENKAPKIKAEKRGY